MPIRRLNACLGLLSLLAGPALAAAESDEGTARFAISVAGIPAGELTLTHSLSGERYRAGGEMRATGLIGAISRIRFDGDVTGRVASDGRLEPEHYTAFSRSTRSERDTEIVFEGGDPVFVSVVPPRSTTPDIAAQKGTLDPVSAAIALLRDGSPDEVCNDRVELFDGSRRSELRVGRPEEREGATVCQGSYTRLEGEAHSMSDAGDWRFQLVFLPNGDGLLSLHRIELPTRFGLAVMERRG